MLMEKNSVTIEEIASGTAKPGNVDMSSSERDYVNWDVSVEKYPIEPVRILLGQLLDLGHEPSYIVDDPYS